MFTIGTDPEFLVTNKDGRPISAIGVVPYTKEKKLRLGPDTHLFYDNVLAELNVAPAKSKPEFLSNVRMALVEFNKFLSPDFKFEARASLTFPPSECDHDDAKIFGCDPEYCVYNINEFGTIERVIPPVCLDGNTFRSCGGHIHVGHELASPFSDVGRTPLFVSVMDLLVGTTALLIDHDQSSTARRKLYGGAGTHRISDYGLEYRTLSNFWLGSSILAEIIFDLVEASVKIMESDPSDDFVDKIIPPKELQRIINSGNLSEAAALYQREISSRYLSTATRNRIGYEMNTKRLDVYDGWQLTDPAVKGQLSLIA